MVVVEEVERCCFSCFCCCYHNIDEHGTIKHSRDAHFVIFFPVHLGHLDAIETVETAKERVLIRHHVVVVPE